MKKLEQLAGQVHGLRVQQAAVIALCVARSSDLDTRVQQPLGLLNTRLTCAACGAVTRGSYPHWPNGWCGDFPNPLLNRSEWRTGMQRSVQGRFLALESNDSEVRGCERLERELWVGDLLLTVWPICSSRGFSGVPEREAKRSGSIPVFSFMQTNTECPRGVLRSSRSLTTRFSPSEVGSEVQYKAKKKGTK